MVRGARHPYEMGTYPAGQPPNIWCQPDSQTGSGSSGSKRSSGSSGSSGKTAPKPPPTETPGGRGGGGVSCGSPTVQNFVTAHISDTVPEAASLSGGNIEGDSDILGLSAVESGWGTFQWKDDQGNFHAGFQRAWFGMHGPLSGESQCAQIPAGGGCVAEFPSYAAAVQAWARTDGQLVVNVTDPNSSYTIMQD